MIALASTVETPVKPSATDDTFKTFLDKLKPGSTPVQEPEHPQMFAVVLHNDPITLGNAVLRALIEVFDKSSADAARLMLAIHHGTRGICGVFSKDVAETKVSNAVLMIKRDCKAMMGASYECDPQFTIEPEGD